MDVYDSAGVDLTLIRWMLSLTPSERLDFLEGSLDFVMEIRNLNGPHPISSDSPEIR
jgi:hypothetical protein